MPGDAISTLAQGILDQGIASTGWESIDDEEPISCGKEYSCWSVKEEGGLYLSPTELQALEQHSHGVKFHQQPLEVSSRILDFEGNWEKEIQTVLGVFQDLRNRGVRFITNSTTGFHIHVGFWDQGVPLRTAKSVLQFCTGFEDRLDALYSVDRLDGEFAEKTANGLHFNAGLAYHFQHNPKTDFGPNIFHWLVSIEEAKSHAELGEFFCNDMPGDPDGFMDKTNGHYCTLNLDNLYSPPMDTLGGGIPPTGTIEFRQHQGTLEPEAIIAQVLLKQAIVSFCHYVPDVDFLKLFPNIADPSFQLTDLLQAIHCRQDLIDYHIERCSPTSQTLKEMAHREIVERLKNGQFQGVMALDAQNFIEYQERSNYKAVSDKINSKYAAGAYAEQDTRDFDVLTEYEKFWFDRCGYVNVVEATNETRIMVFQQLNGDDIHTDPTPEMMLR